MSGRLGRFRREDGQTMVEFVLLFPLLLVLALMLVEFGFALNAYITVNNASTEAARYAAVGSAVNGAGPCDSGATPSIEGLAVRVSSDLLACSDVDVGYIKRMPEAQYVRGDAVGVEIEYVYQMVTPLGDLMTLLSFGTVPNTLTMTACAEARLERGPVSQAGLQTGSGCS